MLDNLFSWLLIPAAGAFGWALARRGWDGSGATGDSLRREAIVGLSTLISDDADQAIGALNRAIEAEPGAVELRLTLGGLFRKKGEVDRAILVHEALLVQNALSNAQLAQVRLALAQDYLKAGVLDRAEAHALALVDHGVEVGPALELLLDLYEQGRDWARAIDTAMRWQAARGQSAVVRIAQYHCEIAEKLLAQKQSVEAREAAEKALLVDPACVRASLMLGAMAETLVDHSGAFDHYARVLEQEPAFIPESLLATRRSALAAQREEDFRDWLDAVDALPRKPAAAVLAKAQWLSEHGGDAANYLAGCAQNNLSTEGLLVWLDAAGAVNHRHAVWPQARELLIKRAARGPKYRCQQCGFAPGLLFWQCPSCKSWATVRPADAG